MAAKRTAGDGGLSEKVGYYADSDGQRLEYRYWQASREVPAELLPRGLSRKRVTGSGKSRTEALAARGELGSVREGRIQAREDPPLREGDRSDTVRRME